MALWLSGELSPPQELHLRLLRDLGAIRSVYGDSIERVNQIRFRAPWGVSQTIVGFDEETYPLVEAGDYHAWDGLNQTYQLSRTKTSTFGRSVLLRLEGLLHPERLSDSYAALPGVTYAVPNGVAGDASNIIPSIGTGGITYIFRDAWGDCPAGCIYERTWEFLVGPDGEPNLVEVTEPGSTLPPL